MLDPRNREQQCRTPGLSSLEKALGQVGTTGAEALPARLFSLGFVLQELLETVLRRLFNL